MLKLKKLLVSILIILNLICVSVFAITESEFETSFESWASGKTFGSYLLDNTIKSAVVSYVNTNYSGYSYMYCGCGHISVGTPQTYILIILSNNGAKLSTFNTTSTSFLLKFDKDITALTVRVKDTDKSTIISSTEGLQGSMSAVPLYVKTSGTNYTRLQSDGSLDNSFFNYNDFLESSTPIPPDPPDPPDPVVPDFTIALLLSSVSSGISDFSTFLNIIFADNFFVSIVLILISIFIILLAVRIIKKFMRRKDEKIF